MGQFVAVEQLEAVSWATNGRNGVAFRAISLKPKTGISAANTAAAVLHVTGGSGGGEAILRFARMARQQHGVGGRRDLCGRHNGVLSAGGIAHFCAGLVGRKSGRPRHWHHELVLLSYSPLGCGGRAGWSCRHPHGRTTHPSGT